MLNQETFPFPVAPIVDIVVGLHEVSAFMNYYAIGWLHILNVTIRLLCPNSIVEGPNMFAVREAQLLWPDAKIT